MNSKYLFCGLFGLAACSQDEIVSNEEGVLPQEKYLAIAPTFQVHNAGQTLLPDSRVNVNIDGGKLKYTWDASDLVGIFPQATVTDGHTFQGDQVYFQLQPNEINNGKTATFDGGGWAVKKGFAYRAYCPFNKEGGFGQDMTKMSADFTNQMWSEGNYLANRIYMVSNGTAAENESLHFNFQSIVSIGWCDITLPETGSIRSLTFQSPEGEHLFCQKGLFDLTAEQPAITFQPEDMSATFTLGTSDTERPKFIAGQPLVWKFVQAPLTLKDKICQVTVNYTNEQQEEKTASYAYQFAYDWEAGDAYIIQLHAPQVNAENHSIQLDNAGSLTLDNVYEAMGETGQLTIEGTLNGDDFAILREAAGYTSPETGATTAGTPASTLVNLDLSNVQIVQGGTKLSTQGNTVGTNLFAHTQLTSLTLPVSATSLKAGFLENTPLESLIWLPVNDPVEIEAGAFNNFTNGNQCAVKVNKKLVRHIDNDVEGKLLFCGTGFQTITLVDEQGAEIPFNTVNAETHTIEANAPGFITREKIVQALNNGTSLKIAGVINGKDILSIYKACSDGSPIMTDLDLSRCSILASDHVYKTINGTEYKTEDNVVGPYMFDYVQLNTIELPQNITTIRERAFSKSSLTEITIPNSVTTIENGILSVCRALTSVRLSEGCKKISNDMLSGCVNLKNIKIPAAVETIEENAFSFSGFVSLTLPATVRSVGNYSLARLASLQSFTIEGADTQIAEKAFEANKTATEYFDCLLALPAAKKGDVTPDGPSGKFHFKGGIWGNVTYISGETNNSDTDFGEINDQEVF